MIETGLITDNLGAEMMRARGFADAGKAKGRVHAQLFSCEGDLLWEEIVENLITTVGDAYYMGRAALSSGLPAQATGMRLGTGTTAAAKTGAGAAIVTYLTGSNKAFDSGFPSVASNVVTYKRTYAAGEATSASTAIAECVINNDTIANDNATTATASATISRALFSSPTTKQAGDAMVVTWTHTFTGA